MSIELGQKKEDRIHIIGAGPAGLSAAITVAMAGRRAIVHERRPDVGCRFHGDFQGLENWTTRGDVIEELEGMGISADFEKAPVNDLVFFDPTGREHTCHSSTRPFFYLVRRGSQYGTLDLTLRRQAVALGVDIHFGDAVDHLPQGGIIAHGPRNSDAVAVGYTFDTNMPDGIFGAISENLATKGYSYLLVHKGRGTIAACLFSDFHNEKVYLERTLDFFREKTGVTLRSARPFGGTGNFIISRTARRGNLLFAGEAAGFQDALWGFGMRYAVVSGHLAARALVQNEPEVYDRGWNRRFGGTLSTSIVNRYLFEKAGVPEIMRLFDKVDRTSDPRELLRKQYNVTFWKSMLSPLARRAFLKRERPDCALETCDCTWCRCQHELALATH
jgi:flavin-dependent dehydrogenase